MLEAKRNHLPDTRGGVTHKGVIHSAEFGKVDLYITVGLFDDGTPGELFVRMAKQGAPLGAMLDQWAIALSIALQCGVPLDTYTDKFRGAQFEPRGFTEHLEIKSCTSPVDYVARWLALSFLDDDDSPSAAEPQSDEESDDVPSDV